MKIVRIGLDLAKNVFSVCGVDEHGKVAVRKTLRRDQVLVWFAQVPMAVVGMEACSGAHDWAQELLKLGHEARIMDSRFVAPSKSPWRLAAKHARILWAMLPHGEIYRPNAAIPGLHRSGGLKNSTEQ